jgi:hypothetical protein
MTAVRSDVTDKMLICCYYCHVTAAAVIYSAAVHVLLIHMKVIASGVQGVRSISALQLSLHFLSLCELAANMHSNDVPPLGRVYMVRACDMQRASELPLQHLAKTHQLLPLGLCSSGSSPLSYFGCSTVYCMQATATLLEALGLISRRSSSGRKRQ